MAPKLIPLNLRTLYADLLQGVAVDDEPASITRRNVGGKARLYATTRDRRQLYLGTADDPAAEAAAAAHRAAASRARSRRKTITALKAAGVSTPDAFAGRVIEAMARAGLFERGAVLIGTAAYQTYPLVIGAFLSTGALATQDADLAITRIAARQLIGVPKMLDTLKTIDPTFAPRLSREHRNFFTFQAANGFMVDMLTTMGRSSEPVLLEPLDCGALPLKYLDYLMDSPMTVAALVGSGVRIRVPQPVRYALHKLIIAGRRGNHDPKAAKDVAQARELLDALRAQDEQLVDDAIDDIESRGPGWRRAIRDGLRRLNAAQAAGGRRS